MVQGDLCGACAAKWSAEWKVGLIVGFGTAFALVEGGSTCASAPETTNGGLLQTINWDRPPQKRRRPIFHARLGGSAAEAFADCPLSFNALRDIQRRLSGGLFDVRGPVPQHAPLKTDPR